MYRSLLHHDIAARLHNRLANLTVQMPYTRAGWTHDVAGPAHEDAARLAAQQIPMDYNIYRGLRTSSFANRMVLADFIDEHGLEREARNIRMDPTGHIGRAIGAYRAARHTYSVFHREAIDRNHKAAIAAATRANINPSKANYRRAAALAGRAAVQAGIHGHALADWQELHGWAPRRQVWEMAQRRYRELGEQYRENP